MSESHVVINRFGSETDQLVEHYGKPIAALLADPTVTEICIDRYDYIYFERDGFLHDAPDVCFASEHALEQFIKQIAHAVAQEANNRNPLLDARLPDKTRISATLPPVAIDGPCMSIRPFPQVHRSLEDLVAQGALEQRMNDLIQAALHAKLNILTTGGTGTGKTSFMRAMLRKLSPTERIIIIEDTTENLAPFHRRRLQFEAPRRRRLGVDDQFIDMTSLIVEALRKRPDRIIVGEIRTPSACAAVLDALNTGHGGTLASLHATSGEDAEDRLTTLFARQAANVPMEAIRRLVLQNIQFVIHLTRDLETTSNGPVRVTRRVKEIVWIDSKSTKHLVVRHHAGEGYRYDEKGTEAFEKEVVTYT